MKNERAESTIKSIISSTTNGADSITGKKDNVLRRLFVGLFILIIDLVTQSRGRITWVTESDGLIY